jgi:uncharacterized protein (DUF362 family)
MVEEEGRRKQSRRRTAMTDWKSGHVVCVHKVELAGDTPGPEAFHQASLELLRAMDLQPGKSRVVIKPNIVREFPPESGVVTHPAFVGGIIGYMKEIGWPAERIAVAEGGGPIETDHDMLGKYFPGADYTAMQEEWGVELVDLNEDEPQYMPVPEGQVFSRMGIAATIADPDAFFINVPKMKTHNLGITTLSIKSLMGTVVPFEERHMCTLFPRYKGDKGGLELDRAEIDSHQRWSQKVCDILAAHQPDLNLIEGVIGRDGSGFRRGRNIPMGLAIAGVNAVAVDTVSSYLMGFNPSHIGYLNVAAERGLGTNDLGRIEVCQVENGRLTHLSDLESLRADPPFEIILAGQFKYTSLEGLIYSRIEDDTSVYHQRK